MTDGNEQLINYFIRYQSRFMHQGFRIRVTVTVTND